MATKKSNLKAVKPTPIKIDINGREYDFVLDLNAFAELEDSFGSINDLLFKMEQGSAKAIRALVWAGLQSNDNPPTIKEVGQSLNMQSISALSATISEAMQVALPDSEGSDPN